MSLRLTYSRLEDEADSREGILKRIPLNGPNRACVGLAFALVEEGIVHIWTAGVLGHLAFLRYLLDMYHVSWQ